MSALVSGSIPQHAPATEDAVSPTLNCFKTTVSTPEAIESADVVAADKVFCKLSASCDAQLKRVCSGDLTLITSTTTFQEDASTAVPVTITNAFLFAEEGENAELECGTDTGNKFKTSEVFIICKVISTHPYTL